jgi:hypothetical protein
MAVMTKREDSVVSGTGKLLVKKLKSIRPRGLEIHMLRCGVYVTCMLGCKADLLLKLGEKSFELTPLLIPAEN